MCPIKGSWYVICAKNNPEKIKYILCNYQQLKLKVWRRLHIPFRFLSLRKSTKFIFKM